MAHENARNGIGKVFTAQILQIITVVCTLIAGIASAVVLAAAVSVQSSGEVSAGAAVGGGISVILAGLFFITAAVISIIAFILQLVGLNKAGKDNEKLHSAFTLSIVAIIVAFVGGIVSSLFSTEASWVKSIVDIVALVIGLVITNKVLMGCGELNSSLQEKADKTWKMYMCVIILDIVVALVTIIMGAMGITAVSAVAYIILIVLDGVLDFISYIMFLTFLAKARKEV